MIENKKTSFGFQEVSYDQKRSLINSLFSDIANKYDLMNDLMSVGVHRLWKERFCQYIDKPDAKIIDVASGSGDIAIKLAKAAIALNKVPDITLCDINVDMLAIARDRTIDLNILDLNYIVADGTSLPFADNSFDYYTIAFGIRNFTDINIALKEAYRIIKPGGKFLCMEFSQVDNLALQQLYHLYSFKILPKIGRFITGNEGAYQYLAESIAKFPSQEIFRNMISTAGFSSCSYQNLSRGIVAIHQAYKLGNE